jgi:hypothetical protein
MKRGGGIYALEESMGAVKISCNAILRVNLNLDLNCCVGTLSTCPLPVKLRRRLLYSDAQL